jgi:TatD DNase family protein
MIDVHAHLTSIEFLEDLGPVLARAEEAGISSILTAGEDYQDNLGVLDCACRHPIVRACLGHYPTKLDSAMARCTIELIRDRSEVITAISEVGLDFYKAQAEEERALQREIFSLFIELSLELSLPLVVHSRSAGRHVVDMLMKGGAKRACLHAFDGKASYARQAAEAGFYFSIPPSIVRSPQKQNLVNALPLECLLLESDSPVLGPAREERNEPSQIIRGALKIAEIKGISLERVACMTTENAERLFLLSK